MRQEDELWRLVCWRVILECYQLYKRHSREDPVDWQLLHDEALTIQRKYPMRMCEEILLAIVSELERHSTQ